MAVTAYYTWDRQGRPFRVAEPCKYMVAYAKQKGIRVLGTIGNEDHLQANFPEDHTPFSYTAWPVPLPDYVVCACDLANEKGIGAAILRDARAGKLKWLKYMNVAGVNYSYSDGFRNGWKNTDQHLHLSCFSDETRTNIDGYDPLGDLMYSEWPKADKAALAKDVTDEIVDRLTPIARASDRAVKLGVQAEGERLSLRKVFQYSWGYPEYTVQLLLDVVIPTLQEIAAGVTGVDINVILQRMEEYATAEVTRDAHMRELITAAVGGEADAMQTLRALADILHTAINEDDAPSE